MAPPNNDTPPAGVFLVAGFGWDAGLDGCFSDPEPLSSSLKPSTPSNKPENEQCNQIWTVGNNLKTQHKH